MDKSEFQRFRQILQQPTAPFREDCVVAEVERQLLRSAISSFKDDHGNLVIGVDSPRAYRARLHAKSHEPLRLFIAHMDHPGFHATRWIDDRTLVVRWLGGSPVKHLRGALVWLGSDEGEVAQGRLANIRLTKSGRSLDKASVRVSGTQLRSRFRRASRLHGGLCFRAPLWRQGKRVYARAVDDLAGVHAIVEVARRIRHRKTATDFLGLLTRGEEVGFVGAVNHLESGWFTAACRPVVAVSLEASRTLSGAVISRGPIVRLGDRRSVFCPDLLQVLSVLAEKHLPSKHQRRIMDGGACEASATVAWGLPTVALSVPLGNYHNQGFEGGPDCRGNEGPAPEFIHLDDLSGMITLCEAMMKSGLPWGDPWSITRRRLVRLAAGYRKTL